MDSSPYEKSILISKELSEFLNEQNYVLLKRSYVTKKIFDHINSGHFEIIVVQNQKLLLFNSFDYNTPEDFLYYILFTAEQLSMNPENFTLELIGKIDTESDYFKIAYKYIRNVSLIDVEDFRGNNYFSEVENRNHFILFNS